MNGRMLKSGPWNVKSLGMARIRVAKSAGKRITEH
jgi:hypothetical protein